MRLNAYLARAGVDSRRGADELIKAGRVKVNGAPGELNTEASETDIVSVDDKVVIAQELRYILLYKPAGTVTTLKDPRGRRTVIELLNLKNLRVVPVGRLDWDTTGALLLTNDGELAHKLMHPSFEVDKVYEADVVRKVTDGKLKKLERGVVLEDGKATTAKARHLQGWSLQQGPTLQVQRLELTIHEGRKHQVKRMLAAVDLPVKKLHRSKYGPLTLEGLRPGQWRELTPAEVNRLKQP